MARLARRFCRSLPALFLLLAMQEAVGEEGADEAIMGAWIWKAALHAPQVLDIRRDHTLVFYHGCEPERPGTWRLDDGHRLRIDGSDGASTYDGLARVVDGELWISETRRQRYDGPLPPSCDVPY